MLPFLNIWSGLFHAQESAKNNVCHFFYSNVNRALLSECEAFGTRQMLEFNFVKKILRHPLYFNYSQLACMKNFLHTRQLAFVVT